MHDGPLSFTTVHNVRLRAETQLISTIGSSRVESHVIGYTANCACGWEGYYHLLDEANEAAARHSQGLDPTPTSKEDTTREREQREEQAREEFERVRKRMLETGDPFCE